MTPATKQSQTADLVRQLRQRLELSQEGFAAKLGVSFRTVNRWENERSIPSPMALMLIKTLLTKLGERGSDLLNQYFPEEN
jgi:DNA-binding transcriptional regulator YiaG